MMTLATICALEKLLERETYCRGVVDNGVTKEGIRAIIHDVAIYSGIPLSLECFKMTRKMLKNLYNMHRQSEIPDYFVAVEAGRL